MLVSVNHVIATNLVGRRARGQWTYWDRAAPSGFVDVDVEGEIVVVTSNAAWLLVDDFSLKEVWLRTVVVLPREYVRPAPNSMPGESGPYR